MRDNLIILVVVFVLIVFFAYFSGVGAMELIRETSH